MTKTKSIIRWAGGKVWLTDRIRAFLPVRFENYFEPFLGGASVFLTLKNHGCLTKGIFLSDINEELINAYRVIRDKPSELINALKIYSDTKEIYYNTRNSIPKNEIERAARFLFLNRTSYNGVYRVNLKGDYNVPYGFRNLSYLFKEVDIFHLSNNLQNSNLNVADFDDIAFNIRKNDLVFLDPPYTVAHGQNGFLKYNQKIFAWKDQERLRNFIDRIISVGAYFILTNASHESIETLYSGIGDIQKLSRMSLIGGKGANRNNYEEYIFFNTKQ